MFKAIILDFKEYYSILKAWLFYRRHSLKLKLAISLAKMKQSAINKQYCVILTSSNKLVAVNNKEIEILKRTNCYSPRQMRFFAEKYKEREVELIEKLWSTDQSIGEKNSLALDIKTNMRNELNRMRTLKLIDKRVDVKKESFYYTPEGDNNKMSSQEQYEAKQRYIAYASKYMK
jgi:hypothetical protein